MSTNLQRLASLAGVTLTESLTLSKAKAQIIRDVKDDLEYCTQAYEAGETEAAPSNYQSAINQYITWRDDGYKQFSGDENATVAAAWKSLYPTIEQDSQ